MNGRDFVFWLKGYIELTETGTAQNNEFGLSAIQLELVEQKLDETIYYYENIADTQSVETVTQPEPTP